MRAQLLDVYLEPVNLQSGIGQHFCNTILGGPFLPSHRWDSDQFLGEPQAAIQVKRPERCFGRPLLDHELEATETGLTRWS